MMDRKTYEKYRDYAAGMLESAGIVITEEEFERIEVADFGLGRFEETGLMAVTYVNTQRCCAKELILMPGQICPEHRHPAQGTEPGKEETFRCRKGEVFLYVEGVDHKIHLLPGQQYTLKPDTKHWFQAGDEGCIVSEFSTHNDDATDIFTDQNIKRIPRIEE